MWKCHLSLWSCLIIISGCHTGRAVQISNGTFKANDGLPIVYDAKGAGDTALVLIHCWACDRTFWSGQFDAMADRYRVVAMDLAGHGDSGKSRQEWTLASLAEDVAGLIKQLQLKRVVLVGHSMGAPVALLTAQHCPKEVVGIISVDSLQNAEFKWTDDAAKRWLGMFKSDFDAAMSQAVTAMIGDDTEPAHTQQLIERACAVDRSAALALMAEFPTLDLPDLMSKAGVPIRGINAARAVPTAIDINRKYADYDAVVMDDVGHYLMLVRPEEFNQHLIAAVDSIVQP